MRCVKQSIAHSVHFWLVLEGGVQRGDPPLASCNFAQPPTTNISCSCEIANLLSHFPFDQITFSMNTNRGKCKQ